MAPVPASYLGRAALSAACSARSPTAPPARMFVWISDGSIVMRRHHSHRSGHPLFGWPLPRIHRRLGDFLRHAVGPHLIAADLDISSSSPRVTSLLRSPHGELGFDNKWRAGRHPSAAQISSTNPGRLATFASSDTGQPRVRTSSTLKGCPWCGSFFKNPSFVLFFFGSRPRGRSNRAPSTCRSIASSLPATPPNIRDALSLLLLRRLGERVRHVRYASALFYGDAGPRHTPELRKGTSSCNAGRRRVPIEERFFSSRRICPLASLAAHRSD